MSDESGASWFDSFNPLPTLYDVLGLTPSGSLPSSLEESTPAEQLADAVSDAGAAVEALPEDLAVLAKETATDAGAAISDAAAEAVAAVEKAATDAAKKAAGVVTDALPWWVLPAAGVALLTVAGFVALPYVAPFLNLKKG